MRSKRRANPDGRMPLFDHLRELRNRLVKAVLAIVLGMILAGIFSNQTWTFITKPFCEATIRGMSGCHQVGDTLIVTSVFDGFFLRIKVAFFLALIATCPVWLYQLWAFIAPGLYSREKKWAYVFTFSAAPLFVGGAFLAYLVMDRGLHYLLGLSPSGVLPLITADSYLGYFTGMLLGFGLVFEVPLLIVMLNIVGVLTHERFRKWRRLLIFGIFLLAGIVNPSPDPWTMLLLGGLAVLLTELAEVFVYFNDKRRARLHPDPYAGLADDELSTLDDTDQADDRERVDQ
ncbi:MAG TPA: twin-arginine translocase subunit TatC [Trebonia sp.]|nr:twin-arginine translocase subunit TatC [Trebonia sp.]